MMRALVTGGAGFIGSHVVDVLLEYGWDVDVMDDLSTGSWDNLKNLAKFHHHDISTPETAGKVIAIKPDAIFHLAAQADVPTSLLRPLQDLQTNIIGTFRMLEIANNLNVKLVFSSTGGAIYGHRDWPADEEDRECPKSPYAVSKLAAEKYLLAWNDLFGMDNVILRYSNVYGPRQRHDAEGGVVAIFKHKLANGEFPTIYGDGTQYRDFIHVSDVASVTVSAVNLRGGIYNVGTGVMTTINDLAEMMGAEACHYEGHRRGDVYGSVISPNKLCQQLIGWKPKAINAALLQ